MTVKPHLLLNSCAILLYCKSSSLQAPVLAEQKIFHAFVCIYNFGMVLTSIMMIVRGVIQVLGVDLSKAVSSAISGIAGIGHILVEAGIILFTAALRKSEGK